MRSPWLDIPLHEYERHMSMPGVDQTRLIAEQLGSLVNEYRPASVAVVGCAGGNGFEEAARGSVRRIVGIDINPDYIERAAQRYGGTIPGLELHVADVESTGDFFEPVDLIYAALVLEYVSVSRALGTLKRHCKPGGVVVTLTQLPHEGIAAVTPSPYTSLQLLEPRMKLVSPPDLRARALDAGLEQEHKRSETLTSSAGKHFALDVFRNPQ